VEIVALFGVKFSVHKQSFPEPLKLRAVRVRKSRESKKGERESVEGRRRGKKGERSRGRKEGEERCEYLVLLFCCYVF